MRFFCFITLFIAIATQINSRPLDESDGLHPQDLGNAIGNKWNEIDDFDDKIQSGWTGKQKDDDRFRTTLDGYDEHNYDYGSLYDDNEGDYGISNDQYNEYADYNDYNDFTSIPQEDNDLIGANPYGLTVINHQPKTGRFDPIHGQLQIQQMQDGSEIHIHPQDSLGNFVHPEEGVQFQQLEGSQPIIMAESDHRAEALEEQNYLDDTIDLEQYGFSPEELEYLEKLEELNPSAQLQLPIDNDYSELEYLDYGGVPVLLDHQKEGRYSLVDVDGDGDPDYLLDEGEPELLVLPEGAEVLEQDILLNPEGLVSSNQTIEDSELILYETPEYVDESSGEIVKPAGIVLVQPELIEPLPPMLIDAPLLLDPEDEEQLIEELDFFNSSEKHSNHSIAIKEELNRLENLPGLIADPEEIELLKQALEEAEYLEGLDPLGYLQEHPNSLVDIGEEPLDYAYEDPGYLFDENATYFDYPEETVLLDGDHEEPYVLSPEDEAYLEQEYPEVLEDLLHGDAGQLDSQHVPLTFDEELEELDYHDFFEAPEDYSQMPVLPDYVYKDPEYRLDENDEYFDENELILGEDEQDGLDHLNTDYVTHPEEANYIDQEHLEEPVSEYEYQEYEDPADYEYVDEYGESIYVDVEQEVDYLDAHEDPEQFAQLQDEVEHFEHHEPLTISHAPIQMNQTQGESSQSVILEEKEQYDHTESIENVQS